ncbi:unnamed protein product [Cylicocyclus nassatus]|uniref:EGF-like domain-containing protein n=1 Tax=Cylicocyclus nassatus TaxID=53992 RepID=A0AA36M3S3_CYLNA|nr:unnamed protein product [Cylicocyclus nassatus]
MKDCENGLDESHCSYLHTCPPGDFLCRTGECVSGKYKCDGTLDCPGGEDERSCDYSDQVAAAARIFSSIITDCPEHMFHCSLGPCVARKYLCDGEYDCPLGDDEDDCTKNNRSELRSHELTSCEPGQILCADHTACFPKNWVCDGEKDCMDGSDEDDCELSVDNFLAEPVTELCKAGEHRCRGGKVCIPLNHTCNGTPDCPDQDDEGPLCNECSTRKIRCEYKCVNTPLGRPNGAHFLPFSYECTCAPGYRLGLDAHSCRLDRTHEGMLFVALGHEVRSMPLFDSRTSVAGYETIQAVGSLGVVRSVDYHISEQLLYITIAGSNLNGEVVNPSLTPGISICTKDGFFCRRIVNGKAADPIDQGKKQQYRGLALHPQRGAMVWIESYGSHHKIVSANMDGTNVRNLVENKLEYPTGLSIDFIRSDVYFGDVERQMIERVNMDTKERATFALKVSELSIHHESARSIHSFTTLPYGLAINHTMFQDQSHIGSALMKEHCLHGCLNGGQCHDIKNEHGTTVKIVCKYE